MASQAASALSAMLSITSYWHEGAGGQWLDLNPAAPPELPLGTELWLLAAWLNMGAVSFMGRVELAVTKPDGSWVPADAKSGQDKEASPGVGSAVVFGPVALDQVGLYLAQAQLKGKVVGTTDWVVVATSDTVAAALVVAAPEPEPEPTPSSPIQQLMPTLTLVVALGMIGGLVTRITRRLVGK